MRIVSPLRALQGAALTLAAVMGVGCSSESTPTGNENVQVQVGTWFFFQDYWTSSTFPSALLTGPRNSATFTFTNTNTVADLSSKANWHKYKFDLQPDDVVTLRVTVGANLVFERSCTVHPRALQLTYAEFIAYGRDDLIDEMGNPLPPGPDAQCGCGFREYGDGPNTNQCSP